MKMKAIFNKALWFVAAILYALVLFVGQAIMVQAEETADTSITYTNVLDDLSKDEKFKTISYPADDDDYSLNVIQIAESADKELFVYVYQPSTAKDLTAMSINISTSENGDGVHNYTLKLVSTESVFDKYVVNDFEVKNVVLRYYHISSIFRAYDATIDAKPTDDNTTSQVSYGVGQLWTATTVDGTVVYAVNYMELITITKKHVGFIRYTDLHLFGANAYTDSHYVAFCTDKPIDNLLSAEIMFSYVNVTENDSWIDALDSIKPSAPVGSTVFLDAEQLLSKNSWFHDDYEYNRIQSTSEFLSKESDSEELTSELKTVLKDTEWVLRFFESECTETEFSKYGLTKKYYSTVSDVSILRLDYEYDGEVYSLGVVDNISSGDSNPDNKDWDKNDWWANFKEEWNEMWQKMKSIIGIVILVVVIVLACSLFPPILNVFVWIFKALWWLIAFPFNLIGKLFKRKNKKNKDE